MLSNSLFHPHGSQSLASMAPLTLPTSSVCIYQVLLSTDSPQACAPSLPDTLSPGWGVGEPGIAMEATGNLVWAACSSAQKPFSEGRRALAHVAQWVGLLPARQRIAGLISSGGTCRDRGPCPQLGCI